VPRISRKFVSRNYLTTSLIFRIVFVVEKKGQEMSATDGQILWLVTSTG